ncbi:MAG: TIGR03016 family PEP-CTERM system-associated outer membrane protein [Halorhodospira sp.]
MTPQAGQAATDWTFTPRVTVGHEWTDNAGFAERGSEVSDHITLLQPGFSLTGEGGRATVSLRYLWDNRFYWEDSDRDRSFHRLRGAGDVELVRNSVFVDGSIRRDLRAESTFQPLTAGEEEETTRYRVSPYWIWRQGRFTEQQVRYTFDEIRYHRSEREPQQVHRAQYRLDSGPQFGSTFWQLLSERSWDRFEDPDRAEVDRLSNEATLGYQFGGSLRLSATGSDGWNRVEDGAQVDTQSWRVNADWAPLRNTRFQGSYGRFKDEIEGLERTNRREQRSLSITHQAPRSTYQLSYAERRSDSAARALNPEATDIDLLLADIGLIDSDELLVDDDRIIFTETWRASWDYETGVSTFRIELAQLETDREFELGDTSGDAVDQERRATGLWRWAIGSRTDANLRGVYREVEGADRDQRERMLEEYRVSLGLSRSIGRRTTGDLDYTYRQSVEDREDRGSDVRRRENRITARLTMEF